MSPACSIVLRCACVLTLCDSVENGSALLVGLTCGDILLGKIAESVLTGVYSAAKVEELGLVIICNESAGPSTPSATVSQFAAQVGRAFSPSLPPLPLPVLGSPSPGPGAGVPLWVRALGSPLPVQALGSLSGSGGWGLPLRVVVFPSPGPGSGVSLSGSGL